MGGVGTAFLPSRRRRPSAAHRRNWLGLIPGVAASSPPPQPGGRSPGFDESEGTASTSAGGASFQSGGLPPAAKASYSKGSGRSLKARGGASLGYMMSYQPAAGPPIACIR